MAASLFFRKYMVTAHKAFRFGLYLTVFSHSFDALIGFDVSDSEPVSI